MLRYWLLCVLFVSQLFSSPLTIPADGSIPAEFSLDFIHDADRSLVFEQVQDINFTQSTSNSFSLGYIPGQVWFRFSITNQGQSSRFLLNFSEAFYDDFTLYIQEGNNWAAHQTGLVQPLSQRMVYDILPSYPLKIKSGETKTFYLRTYSRFATMGELRIYSYEDYFSSVKLRRTSLHSFYFGSLIVIITLNLFLFIRLREKIYGFYAAYVFFFGLFVLLFSGLDLYLGLGPVHYLLHFAPSAAMAFLILFSLDFMRIRDFAPRLSTLLFVIALIFLLLVFLIMYDVDPWSMLMNHLSSLSFALLLFTAVYVAFHRCGLAVFYLVIMLPTVTTLALLSLMFTGDLPYQDLFRYSFLVGSFLEFNLFALILAHRFFETRELANRDALTGIYNRHYFNEITPGYLDNALRHHHRLCVLMIDIDDFKQINDTYGHAAGDKVLVKVANYLQGFTRKGDILVRFGGEEFLLVLYETAIEEGTTLAKRICKTITGLSIQLPHNNDLKLTISIGVSELEPLRDSHIEGIIKRADKALYKAKKMGKNCVICQTSDPIYNQSVNVTSCQNT